MPRRRQSGPSTGSMIGSGLSILLAIVIGIVVVFLRAERRAARNQEVHVNDNRGDNGSVHVPSPQPFTPTPPANPVTPPNLSPPSNPQPTVLTPVPVTPEKPPGPKPGVYKTKPEGGFFAQKDYSEYRPDGAILIGFHLGLGRVNNTDVLTYLQPIWLKGKVEELGTAYGRTNNAVITVRARDGYAIGGVVIAGGGALEGICFTFMKRGAKHLLVDDFYVSEWYGEKSRKPGAEAMKSGDGGFVVGFYGKRFEDRGGKNFDDCGSICTLGLTLWVQE